MKIKLELQKKHRYLIQSLLATAFIYLVSQEIISLSLSNVIILILLIVVIGTFIIHYPNISLKNLPFIVLMPISILSGSVLFLYFFPNLGLPFKLAAVASFGALYYLVSLMDNIFLVIQDREEVIPLYRVATVWSEILQIVVAIPLFAGVFKFNAAAFTQALVVGTVTFLYSQYQLWSLQFDESAKKTTRGESLYLSFLATFLVTVSSISVSFMPTESFLRALFTASVLMFALTYITSYLKNEITLKLVLRYLIIVLVFFLLLMFFTP